MEKILAKRRSAALEVAREALASPTWHGLIPFVRQPERVVPLVKEYYSTHAWKPVQLGEVVESKFHNLLGGEFLAIHARDQDTGEEVLIG